MAFDISTGNAPPAQPAVGYDSYDDFFDTNIGRLSRAISLIAPDERTAEEAIYAAAIRASQRWHRIRSMTNPAGSMLGYGVAHVETVVNERPSEFVNEATGGYVRGLDLADAIHALPVSQRAALAAAYFLNWPDDVAAEGFGIPLTTHERRRSRAEDFIRHHLQESDDVRPIIADYFNEQARSRPLVVPDLASVKRSARRRNLQSRLLIGVGGLAAIAVVGLLFNLSTRASAPVVETPDEVGAPTASSDWLGPVTDGRGGFISLNIRGSAKFSSSTDGTAWFERSTWNSRAVDLRTEVTGFLRSGDRYLATIEPAPAISGFVAPRVALSNDLVNWDVRMVDIGLIDEIPGLRTRAEILSAAATSDKVLVAVGTTDAVDYRSLDVQRAEVCAEASLVSEVTIYLCDGTTRRVDKPVVLRDDTPENTQLFLSEAGGGFIEVAMPVGMDPYSLVSFGGGFALVHGATGEVIRSSDGRSWTTGFTPDEPNRLVLLAGSEQGDAMAVVPRPDGWIATTVGTDADAQVASLPISLDPESVWIKPELASGPAGWALFVSTSRPWERTDISRGWAVDTGEWIASRQPDSQLITARAADGSRIYRYVEDDVLAQRGIDERVTLVDPATGEVLVEISQAMIDDSRAGAISGDSGIAAQVFFSRDGSMWRSIWQSSEDSWFGSVAVGDDEVLLTGTQLMGAPITIPISE